MIERDEAYASRLERHYDEIRQESGGQKGMGWEPLSSYDAQKRSSPVHQAGTDSPKRLLARSRKRK